MHTSPLPYPWCGSSAMARGSLRSVLMRTRLLVPSTEATEMDLSPESVQYRLCWSQSTASPTGVCRDDSTSGTCWEGSLASWMKALRVEQEAGMREERMRESFEGMRICKGWSTSNQPLLQNRCTERLWGRAWLAACRALFCDNEDVYTIRLIMWRPTRRFITIKYWFLVTALRDKEFYPLV